MSLLAEAAASSGNATEGNAFMNVNAKSIQYFMALYPLLMSLGIGGSIMSVLYFIFGTVRQKVQAKLYCQVAIRYDDDTFAWVNKYMKDTGIIKDDSQLRCGIKKSQDPWWEEIFKVKDSRKPQLEYSPGAGYHIFKHKGKTIWVTHHIGETIIAGWERMPTEQETLTIITWGNDTSIIKDFIDTAVVHCMEKDNNKIGIYELHRWGIGWTKVQSKKPRPLESVVLGRDNSEMLCSDIKKFQDSAEWYLNKGVPYRRGYLLYGPPGTGKTSFTQAIAGALKLNICYLNLSGNNLDDDGLNRALNDAPSHSIILLEDIDGIFVERESVQQEQQGRRVSFSGLLNALDGVRSQEGRILFMTTNHKEKLDPALLRPGRCDVHVELNNASFKQIRELFLRFFPGQTEKASEFAKQLPESKLSMAKLQGHFLKYRHSSDACLEHATDILKQDDIIAEMTVSEWLDR